MSGNTFQNGEPVEHGPHGFGVYGTFTKLGEAFLFLGNTTTKNARKLASLFAALAPLKGARVALCTRGEGDEYEVSPFAIVDIGGNLARVSAHLFDGIKVSSVHQPNTKTGTGYMITEGINPDSAHEYIVAASKTVAPPWARNSDIEHIKKYSGLDDYMKRPGQIFNLIIEL